MMEKQLEVQRPMYPTYSSLNSPARSAWSPSLLEQESSEPYENIHDLLSVLRARWTAVLSCALGCLTLGVLACFFLTPKYTATASLEVNREGTATSGVFSPEGSSLPEDVKTEVETDTSVLQSSGLALEVIERLHLPLQAPFRSVHIKQEAGLSLDRAPKTRDAYLRLFGKALKVSSVPESRLINIAFRSPDPIVAAQVANTLSETFIADTMERRLHSNATVSFWISKEIETLRDRVRESEQALADFEHKTGLAGIDVQPSTQAGGQSGLPTEAHNAVLDRLNSLNTELTAAEASRISAETIAKLTQSQDPEVVLGLGSLALAGSGGSQAGGLELLRGLRTQQTSIRLELADLQTRYGAQNPRLIQLNSQAQTLDSEIAAEMSRLRTRAENDFRYAQQNEDALRGQLAKQQHLADKFTDDAVQLELLSQEALSNRTLYQSLYSQLNQANVAAGIHATRLDLVDRALVPGSSSSPNYLLLLGASLGAGILLGGSLAFLQQGTDKAVRIARDVESTVHLPVISQLPALAETKGTASIFGHASIIASPRSLFAESCRSLCTAVVGMLDAGSEHRVLLVSSPMPGDGKSTVSYNLAIALAQRGERVLLIDGNMRHPSLRSFFPSNQERGLSDALTTTGTSLADRVSAHPQLPSLSLLPSGYAPELPAELFSSHAFDLLLHEARVHYRWTVIDSPPLLPFTDATIIAEKVDGVIAVARSGATSRDALKTYTKLLLRTRAPLLGFALNCVDAKTAAPLHAAPDRMLEKVSQHV